MSDIDAVLQSAFQQCELFGQPLAEAQKQILKQVITAGLQARSNPLRDLTSEQRQALLHFIQSHAAEQTDWKAALLNDWLQNRDSGSVQFVRELYGLAWLEAITTADVAEFSDEDSMRLKVGDRIEVSNALWEWVKDDRDREWFPCRVVGLKGTETSNSSCTVRFDNGREFEIQGIYDWNRSLWRWIK